MQQCWLKLVSHCLGPGAALGNMFAWVILAYLQNLGVHLGFGGGFAHSATLLFSATLQCNENIGQC